MEIMNYSEMLVNASAVQALVNKTIECSKDYVESRENDIIESMIEYIYLTFKDAMKNHLVTSKFILEVDKYLRGNLWLTVGPFGGDGEGAIMQVHFNRFDSIIRYYMNEHGFWKSQHRVNDHCLEYLIERWNEYKQDLDRGIKDAVAKTNSDNRYNLERQLKLHEAVKNFRV
jgi:hypothetical protein